MSGWLFVYDGGGETSLLGSEGGDTLSVDDERAFLCRTFGFSLKSDIVQELKWTRYSECVFGVPGIENSRRVEREHYVGC